MSRAREHGVALLQAGTGTGVAPAHVAVTPDGNTAYTTKGADGTVTATDVATT